MRGVQIGGLGVIAGLMLTSTAMGQATTPDKKTDPATTQPSTKPAEPAAAPSGGTKVEFPKIVKKNLYAKTDLRGKKAPEFHVEKWLGKDAKAPERKNKIVLIDFWATWCPPCRALIPELNELSKKFKDDVVIIGVSDEDAAKVEGFMAKTKVEYPMAIDTKAQMKDALGVAGIPHVMVIDSTGIVRWQGFPQSDEEKLTEGVLKQIIDADKAQRARAGSPPAEAKPKPESKPAEEPKKK